eukprot:GFYU01039845.1.p3 GENE.GFYU01039845.1~~GFYU01039845.1.p3  ORF type:complete len:116 (+),score=4.72 GFYU01039845.1:180-527(+)
MLSQACTCASSQYRITTIQLSYTIALTCTTSDITSMTQTAIHRQGRPRTPTKTTGLTDTRQNTTDLGLETIHLISSSHHRKQLTVSTRFPSVHATMHHRSDHNTYTIPSHTRVGK